MARTDDRRKLQTGNDWADMLSDKNLKRAPGRDQLQARIQAAFDKAGDDADVAAALRAAAEALEGRKRSKSTTSDDL